MAIERRKPSYNAATRLAAIVLQLSTRPWGTGFGAIEQRFSISERTRCVTPQL
jgi:hypothetical protein